MICEIPIPGNNTLKSQIHALGNRRTGLHGPLDNTTRQVSKTGAETFSLRASVERVTSCVTTAADHPGYSFVALFTEPRRLL